MNIKKIGVILVIILTIFTTNVLAYETDTYSIEIDEDVYEIIEADGIELFQKESGDNIVIQEIEQTVLGGKLTQYQLSTISKEIVEQYQTQYKAVVEEIGREEITVNDKTVIRMSFKTTIDEYEIYQEMNIFVYEDKIFDIIFTTITEDGFSTEEKDTILRSFKPVEITTESENKATTEPDNQDVTDVTDAVDEETPIVSILDNILFVFVGCIFGLVIVYVYVIKSRMKSKKDATELENNDPIQYQDKE